MRVAFRVDASILMGTGHVMRCLTLAQELRAHGHECNFITREHPGNLIEKIHSDGFSAKVLAKPKSHDENSFASSSHADWLGVSWQEDAEETLEALKELSPDWFVIDHYATDAKWEKLVRPVVGQLAVIDDLADRPHDCDLLVDQSFGRALEDYKPLVPARCKLLVGSKYALLRPEFGQLRNISLKRRENPVLRSILVTMGGSDKDNYTSRVLSALDRAQLHPDVEVTVVLGSIAPFLQEVKNLVSKLNANIRLRVDVRNMAELMSYSDLCIGAAGSTAWERCCLGLPTLQLVTASNQEYIAEQLSDVGAVARVNSADLEEEIPSMLYRTGSDQLVSLSRVARAITDGKGASRVARMLTTSRVAT